MTFSALTDVNNKNKGVAIDPTLIQRGKQYKWEIKKGDEERRKERKTEMKTNIMLRRGNGKESLVTINGTQVKLEMVEF